MRVITDACVKIAALEICCEKNTRESVVGTFKNIRTVAVHFSNIKDAFAGFCQQISEKKESEGILRKFDKKVLSRLVDFGH